MLLVFADHGIAKGNQIPNPGAALLLGHFAQNTKRWCVIDRAILKQKSIVGGHQCLKWKVPQKTIWNDTQSICSLKLLSCWRNQEIVQFPHISCEIGI